MPDARPNPGSWPKYAILCATGPPSAGIELSTDSGVIQEGVTQGPHEAPAWHAVYRIPEPSRRSFKLFLAHAPVSPRGR
jgi:hypothetical protein